VDSVLTGINRDLVSEINQLGGEAFGLSGKENNLIQTRPKDGSNGLGYVGTINAVDTTIISRLIDTNLIPVVSPVGKGEDDKLYNVNADEAAYSVASALRAEKIVFMTDVMGVMADKDNADSLYHSLTADNVKKLIKDGVITGGMLPKVNACLKAIEGGVQKAHIVLAGLPHALLLEIFTDKGIGTEIVGSK
jgi:acetylglutamate kinase